MPTLHVHKFGGAALANADGLRRVLTLVPADPDAQTVIVASAMGDTTDALVTAAGKAAAGDLAGALVEIDAIAAYHLAAADDIFAGRDEARAVACHHLDVSFDKLRKLIQRTADHRSAPARVRDRLISYGEQWSAYLLSGLFNVHGRRAAYVDAESIICTDARFGNAFPDFAATERAVRRVVLPLMKRNVTPVVPGFIGASSDGSTVTLGRGGSDLTATTLARVLGGGDVTLWKDVAGFFTADPRVVSDARSIAKLDIREVAELAYYGAKVLHPRALIPVDERTHVTIRSFADPAAAGTEICVRRAAGSGGSPVRALSAIEHQALVTVTGSGMLGVPGVAARTFSALATGHLSVSLISQASSEHSICFAVPDTAAEEARRLLIDAFAPELKRHEIDGVELRRDIAIVAVVGSGMVHTPGIAAKIFGALAGSAINVVAIAQGSSELNVSVVVDGAHAANAQRAIHAAFRLDKVGGGKVSRQTHNDIVLLGFGRVGRELTRQIMTLEPDVRARLRIVGMMDRQGYVFEPRGFSARKLEALIAHKGRGNNLASASDGMIAVPDDALRAIADHALSRPILVDVAAGDTRSVVLGALDHGFDIVLANKVPIASDHETAFKLLHDARARGRRVFQEATVGAGLPIMDAFEKLHASGDRVLSIEGCPSGTLGFLFSALADGRRFSEALRDAMALGYTEPDPRDDLSGLDVARKALILGRLLTFKGELDDIALESLVPERLRAVPLDEFLNRLEEVDAEWQARVDAARSDQAVLRYRVRATSRSVEARLVAVSAKSPLAALHGTDNQFAFTTTRYRKNPLIIRGPGAGPAVTAGGVLNDVLRAMRAAGEDGDRAARPVPTSAPLP